MKKIGCYFGLHEWEKDTVTTTEPTTENNGRWGFKWQWQCKRCGMRKGGWDHESYHTGNPANKWGSLGLCYGCADRDGCESNPETLLKRIGMGHQVCRMPEWCKEFKPIESEEGVK